jgi:hypothetical protein
MRTNEKTVFRVQGLREAAVDVSGMTSERVPAPVNIYVTPLRFKLGGRRIMSARFNVETAGSERKRPEI